MRKDDYTSVSYIHLKPAEEITITFEHEIESASGANDGAFPYGTTLSGVVVSAYDDDTDTTVSGLVDSYVKSGNNVIVKFTYPTAAGTGNYYIINKCTLSNGDILPLYFKKIKALAK